MPNQVTQVRGVDTFIRHGAEGIFRTALAVGAFEPGPGSPWHYVGDMLVIEYWADPEAVAAVLRGVRAARRPWACGADVHRWQSCWDSGDELVTRPIAVQGIFVTVNALYEGDEVADCPYIWVDRDFALARGWIQGFPKKLGSVWITRIWVDT